MCFVNMGVFKINYLIAVFDLAMYIVPLNCFNK